jgi:hypothetical protein
MKILSYTIKADMIRVTTDYIQMPVFVYFKDKFKNLEELENEINNKILEINNKKELQESQISNLTTQLNLKILEAK